MKLKKILLTSAIFIALIITQTGCSSDAQPVSKDNYFLDTTCNISVYEMKSDGGAEKAIDDAYELCAKLDKTLSKTTEASDISKLNSAGGNWVTVSDYTVELLNIAIKYCELSDGAFDITVGGITNQWDFHAENPKLPDANALAEAAKHVDYHNIEINGNDVRLTDPESKLDLGGIAKGYIGDKMAEVLEKDGVNSAIINLGGNIICIGAKGDKDFNIGVEAPFSDRTEIVGSVDVRDKTLVTSGVYERMFKIDDKIYHHILDPKTGWPVESDLNGVTLVADKGHSVDCDAMSTISLIKGYKEAKKFIDSRDGVDAIFILKDGSVKTTSGLKGFNRK